MGLFKCRCCGADLNVKSGDRIVTCDYCGSAQTVPSSDDASVLSVYARGNLLRNQGEFDRAYATLSKLLGGGSEDAELYWNLLLCKYGVTYVDDYGGSKKPTVNRMSVSSILDDEDYRKVTSLADVVSRGNYEEEARRISRIQEEILSIAQKEKPYDVFVSYKETDELGGRTEDSVLAQEIYDGLTEKGYRVFLSRVTLSSVVGHEYEPYIYSALYSSKALILAACDAERVNSAWVRNEWQRYLFMMEGDKGKVLIPCYRGVDPYDFPKELRRLQGIDASKLGWMQDLLIGLKKVIKADKQAEGGKPSTAPAGLDSIADQMVERGFSLLKSGKSGQASKMFEDALGYADKAMAYIGLLCVDLGATSAEEIDEDVSNDSNYEKALDAATPEEKEGIRSIVTRYVDKQNAIKQSAYDKAMKAKESGDYDEAIVGFEGLQSFKDSAEQAEECKKLREEKERQDTYNTAIEMMNDGDYYLAGQSFEKLGSYRDSEFKAQECSRLLEEEKKQAIYEKAARYMDAGDYFHAANEFGSISDFKDSKSLCDECLRIQEDARKEALYQSCILGDDVDPHKSILNKDRLNKAIRVLSSIPGYKDSDRLIVKYESIVKDFEDEMAIKREERKKAKAKRTKQAKKASLITGASALLLVGVMLLTFLYAVPEGRQNSIEKLIDSGNYDEAYSLIQKNGDYGDNSKLKSMLDAGKAFRRGDYEAGIDYIYDIGGSIDVTYDGNGGIIQTSGETIKKAKSHITNEATKNGYTLYGWNLTDYEIDAKSLSASISLSAVWTATVYRIAYNLNGGGTIPSSAPTSYTFENFVSIPDPTRTGYTFIGWTGSNGTMPAKGVAIPRGSTGDKSYTANWEANRYTITLDANGGSVSQDEIDVVYDGLFSLPTPTRAGYEFKGWKDSSTGADVAGGAYTYAKDIILTAQWEAISYSLSFDLDGGTSPSALPTGYTVEDEIGIPDPTREGYAFLGWTGSNGTTPAKGVAIPRGSTGDKSYTANWEANLNVLTVTSMDEAKGTAFVTKGSGYTDEEITVEATPIGDCVFKGWYNGSDLVSKDNPCTFTMPSENYSLSAKFFTKAEEEEEARREALGIDPVVSADGKTLTYGLYPQTHVSDANTIASLNELTAAEPNGWYLLDGAYYAKKSANTDESGYKFDDGTAIVSGTTYWFRCEPIEWKILSSGNGTYSVVSSVLLDAHRYDDSSNNYKDSKIREWLNGAFYDKAFALGNDHIETTEVDNSASTTGASWNSYACANTEDNVYLLSYKDYTNMAYFANLAARQCKTTDWAREYVSWCSNLYNSDYWMRSPHCSGPYSVSFVRYDGDLECVDLGSSYYGGVRPALTLSIS